MAERIPRASDALSRLWEAAMPHADATLLADLATLRTLVVTGTTRLGLVFDGLAAVADNGMRGPGELASLFEWAADELHTVSTLAQIASIAEHRAKAGDAT